MARAKRAVRRDDRGAVALVAALVAVVLLMVCSLVVDLGMTWQRRGELQRQADKAAVYAAAALPATDDVTRLRVAKRVAFYLACNKVPGQTMLRPIPDCPDSPSSAALDAYAAELLTRGEVTFPSSTEVQVITPRAEVVFAFAGAVGVDDTVQRKSATAKVSSPGQLLPIGLSLQCLAGAVNNAGLGSTVDGVLPLSYVTPGAYAATTSPSPDGEPAFVPWESAYVGANASSAVTVGNPVSLGTSLTLTIGSPALLSSLQNLLGGTQVVFKRGGTTVGPVAAASIDVVAQTLVVTVPAAVAAEPGIWHVKVKLYTGSVGGLGLLGTDPRWSSLDTTFAVYPSQTSVQDRLAASLSGLTDLDDLLGCGRLLNSPRVRDGATPALTRNLQEGLDHSLTRNQALVQALSTQNLGLLNGSAGQLSVALGAVDSIIANPTYGLLGCAGSTYNRLDVPSTWAATQSVGAAPANCARIRSDSAAGQELTDGLLKATASSPTEPGYGRLSCHRDGACDGRTTTLPGFSGTYNDDGFADFLTHGPTSLLDSNLAFAVDTYLLPGLPVVTPSDNLREDLYRSPRFGWVPVLSYVDLDSPGEVDYPILTFRPLFLDNGSAKDLQIAGLTPGRVVDGLGTELAQSAQSSVDEVRASLGALSSVLDSVLSTIGMSGVLNHLGHGEVDKGLEQLSQQLGGDFGTEEAGLVLQDGQVKGARFLTIAPDALPAVSTSYRGPVTDYLGVGPKIVRLVR